MYKVRNTGRSNENADEKRRTTAQEKEAINTQGKAATEPFSSGKPTYLPSPPIIPIATTRVLEVIIIPASSIPTADLPDLKLKRALHPILRVIHIQALDLDVAWSQLRRLGKRGSKATEATAEGTRRDTTSGPAVSFERKLFGKIGSQEGVYLSGGALSEVKKEFEPASVLHDTATCGWRMGTYKFDDRHGRLGFILWRRLYKQALPSSKDGFELRWLKHLINFDGF